MIGVATDRFLKTIRRSHQYVSYVDVVGADRRVIRLPGTDGDVSFDDTAETRATCSVTCVDPTGQLTPKDKAALLTPYGSELRPYRGIAYDDGTEEVIPLGVYRISKVDVKDSSGGSPDIKIEGHDRSREVSRDKFTSPYIVEEGTNILTAIKEIVERTLPAVDYDTMSTTIVTSAPLLYDAGSDPWDAIRELATSMGAEAYFGRDGQLVVATPVDIGSLPAPAFTYIEGDGCLMTDLSLVFTDEPGFNGVIVTGESVGDELPPVRGEAWDEEPTSPTYRFGPYGEVPRFVTDQNVKTNEEAQIAAIGLLEASLGFSSQLAITAGVNPAIESGDIVEVRRERSGVNGLYVVDALKVPLKGVTAGLTLRQKRAVS